MKENEKKLSVSAHSEIQKVLFEHCVNKRGWERLKAEIDKRYDNIAFSFDYGKDF